MRGGLGPAEGFGLLIPVREPAHDGTLQARAAIEAAAANRLRGDQAEPALEQVEPRGAGRSEVQMKARMSGPPLSNHRMFMGPVVVVDQMQLTSQIAVGQRFQEGDDLQVGMALEATPVDFAAGHLQRGEQAGRAVASVIVGRAGRQPGPHRQRRLGPVERLNLRLFVHAEHHARASPDRARRYRPVWRQTAGRG